MSHSGDTIKACFHILRGVQYMFSDERIKKKLLDMIFDRYRRAECRILAFCITDSEAYLLSCSDDSGMVSHLLQEMKGDFLQWYGRSPVCVLRSSFFLEIILDQELVNMSEIACCCRQIHRIPLDKGYVHRIHDYWWSSYITYMEIYSWDCVACESLKCYLSAEGGRGRQKIKQFHKGSVERF